MYRTGIVAIVLRHSHFPTAGTLHTWHSATARQLRILFDLGGRWILIILLILLLRTRDERTSRETQQQTVQCYRAGNVSFLFFKIYRTQF